MEPTLLQYVTLPMDAERPGMRYDAERRNEGSPEKLAGPMPLTATPAHERRCRAIFQLAISVPGNECAISENQLRYGSR
jgi:hypothetical protein